VSRLLEPDEVSRQLTGLPGWTKDGQSIRRSISAPDFTAAIRIVDDVAVEAENMDHHPDIDIRWRTLHFVLSTHSAGGITQLDIELAHRISDIANTHGAS